MLTFENEDGKTMCLRPDLTVASCINYLKKKTNSKIYYSGQAYRRSNNKNSSFINEQLGIEIIGSKNQIQDDLMEHVKLTPWQSFGKDIILLFFIAILFINNNIIKPLFSFKIENFILVVVTLF